MDWLNHYLAGERRATVPMKTNSSFESSWSVVLLVSAVKTEEQAIVFLNKLKVTLSRNNHSVITIMFNGIEAGHYQCNPDVQFPLGDEYSSVLTEYFENAEAKLFEFVSKHLQIPDSDIGKMLDHWVMPEPAVIEEGMEKYLKLCPECDGQKVIMHSLNYTQERSRAYIDWLSNEPVNEWCRKCNKTGYALTEDGSTMLKISRAVHKMKD